MAEADGRDGETRAAAQEAVTGIGCHAAQRELKKQVDVRERPLGFTGTSAIVAQSMQTR